MDAGRFFRHAERPRVYCDLTGYGRSADIKRTETDVHSCALSLLHCTEILQPMSQLGQTRPHRFPAAVTGLPPTPDSNAASHGDRSGPISAARTRSKSSESFAVESP